MNCVFQLQFRNKGKFRLFLPSSACSSFIVFCLQPLGIWYNMVFTWQLKKLQCFSPQTAAKVKERNPTQKDTYSWGNAKRINTCICAWEEWFYNPCHIQLMLSMCFRVLRVKPLDSAAIPEVVTYMVSVLGQQEYPQTFHIRAPV